MISSKKITLCVTVTLQAGACAIQTIDHLGNLNLIDAERLMSVNIMLIEKKIRILHPCPIHPHRLESSISTDDSTLR